MPPARPHRPRRHPAHHVLRLVLRRANPHRARAGRDPREDGRAVHPPLHPDDVGQRVQHSHVHVAPGAGHLPAGRGARSTRSRRSGRGPVLLFAQVRIPRRRGGDGGVGVDERASLHRLRGVAGARAQGPRTTGAARRRVRCPARRLERRRDLPKDCAPELQHDPLRVERARGGGALFRGAQGQRQRRAHRGERHDHGRDNLRLRVVPRAVAGGQQPRR